MELKRLLSGRRVMRQYFIPILIVLVLVSALFAGCSSVDTSQYTPTPETSQTPAPTPKTFIYTRGAIEVGGDGEPIELINNPDATNPTYAKLLTFIKNDHTDKYSYIFGPPKVAYICSDFAEDVHNNAEAAGIRAAWVGIDIHGDDEGHALNAFETTDIGLVYIDCTGKGLWSETPSDCNSWNRRARVGIGNEYAVADIDKARSTVRFLFSASVDEYREWGIKSTEILEWLRKHDVAELGRKWMQEWMREHEAELFKCGRELEPVSYWRTQVHFGSEIHFTAERWRLYVDSLDVPWFQPQVEVVEVDGMPVRMEVAWEIWERSWFKPLGIVKDIHIHW